MAQRFPGKGLSGWLGRQFGYIKKAVKTDVTNAPQVVFRNRQVHEAVPADDPNVKLRRTVIDEVIVQKQKSSGQGKQ